MSQSLNWDAVRGSLSVLLKDHTPAIPHFQVETIAELEPEWLWEQGIRGVVFDKDNTITAPYKNEIYPTLVDVVSRFQQQFGENVKILSNSAGTNDDTAFRDAEEIEQALNIPVIRHAIKKPLGYNSIAEHFSCEPSTMLMIGDRLLTDTLFGNRAGMVTIHTGILTLEGDNKVAAVARRWENRLLARWKRAGATPPAHTLQTITLRRPQ